MAELKSYADPSLQILNFLLGAGGTKSTTTQSSSIDPAVMAQINTLLGQQMSQITPEGISALIGSIFRQGAQQVPVLGMQFAQSAGARASNNSPLNLANQQLQTRLADQAMQSLLTAQNQASATAARAADATRTTTNSATQRARSPGLAALPFAIGQIPNLKKGITSVIDLFSPDTGFGSVTGGSGGFGQTVNNPSAYIAPSLGNDGFDVSMFAEGDGLDFSNLLESGQLFADVPFVDIGSSIAESFSAPDYGIFFADGGLVEARKIIGGSAAARRDKEAEDANVKRETPKQQSSGKKDDRSHMQEGNKSFGVRLIDWIRGYADGGMVSARGYADGGAIGARSSIANESTSAPGVSAINTSDAVFGPVAGAGSGSGAPTAVDPLAQLSEDVLSYFAVDEAAGNSGWSPDMVPAPLVKGNVTYERLPSSVQMGGEAFHGQAPLEAFGIDNIIARPTDYDRKAGTGAYRYNSQTGAKTGNMFIKPESNGFMDFLGFLATAAGMATGNPLLAFARSVGARTAMEGVKTGFKEGGEVDGPGTGTSDSIVARLSDGEYVVPADVVEMLGVEFFDGLRDAFHTPVSMQRYHASGTTRNEQR